MKIIIIIFSVMLLVGCKKVESSSLESQKKAEVIEKYNETIVQKPTINMPEKESQPLKTYETLDALTISSNVGELKEVTYSANNRTVSLKLPTECSVLEKDDKYMPNALILPMLSGVYEEELISVSYAATGSMEIMTDGAKNYFRAGDNTFNPEGFPRYNHSGFGKIYVIKNLEFDTVMVHYNQDMYTLDTITKYDMKNKGIATTSDYWKIYILDKEHKDVFCLSLEKNKFTKEAAVTIAKTIKFEK